MLMIIYLGSINMDNIASRTKNRHSYYLKLILANPNKLITIPPLSRKRTPHKINREREACVKMGATQLKLMGAQFEASKWSFIFNGVFK